MNDHDAIYFALNHIMEESSLFNELNEKVEYFFKKFHTAEWLTHNQARMVSEILLSGKREIIMLRLDEYKDRQLKRKSQADKWQWKVKDEKAIDAFYKMIDELPDNTIDSIIKSEFEKLNLTFDPGLYKELIYQTIIQKFNYLFIMKYSIQRKGD